jgi:hypothetical protein
MRYRVIHPPAAGGRFGSNTVIGTNIKDFPPAFGGQETMPFSYQAILIYYQYKHKIMQ